MLPSAALALVLNTAQFPRSATRDQADHFAVTKRNRIAEPLQIPQCMLPQAVSDRRHELLSAKELFDRLTRLGLGRVGQVQIDHRGLQTAVTQVLLNDPQAHARFEQMRRVGMPQACVSRPSYRTAVD